MNLLLAVLLSAPVTLTAAGSLGQETEPSTPAVSAEPVANLPGIEEIVVTARKRAENLQDTPLAVSAIDSKSLESLGVIDTNDISALAPNSYFTQTSGGTSNLALSIRGVGSAEPALIRDSGVGIYLDGVYIARLTGAVFDLLDMERVEVLRGPQGTLYGRNATGGAVNFIPKKPSEDFGIKQSIGTGSYDRLASRTRIDTGELLPGLSAAISYAHNQRDGYVDNLLAPDKNDPGSINSDALRLNLRWEPAEMLTFDYSYDWSDTSGTAQAFQLFAVTPLLASSLALAGVTPVISTERLDELSLERPHADHHRMDGHALTGELDLDVVRLKSITAYRDWHSNGASDLDGNAFFNVTTSNAGVVPSATLFGSNSDRDQRQFSEELQLLGEIGEQIDYVAGAYYFRESFSENNVQPLLFASSAASPPAFITSLFAYRGVTRSWAVFANGTWALPILDERLSLDVGVRYSADEKEIDQTRATVRSGSDDWNHVDWQGTLSFAWTDDVSTYVRVASGYKSGGFNPRASATGSVLPSFDEETLISYEGGLKSQWFDHRLQLNTAVFYSDYDDLQTDVFRAGTTGAASDTINAGKAEILGVELELIAQPIEALTLNLNYGYLDPEYKEFILLDPNPSVNAPVDFADISEFGYRPDTTLSAGVEYVTEPLGAWGLVLSARLDVRYTDDIFWHQATFSPSGWPINQFNDLIHEDGYTLLDARFTISEISLGGDRAKLRTSVFGKNITDEEYITSGIDFGRSGFAGANFGEPATWGVDFTFEY